MVTALESLALVTAMLKNRGIEAEIVQVQASRAGQDQGAII